jgi:hypothetical protein
MAIIFESGFEELPFTGLVKIPPWTNTVIDFGGTLTVEAVNPNQGIYNLNAFVSTHNKGSRAIKSFAAEPLTFLRLYVKFNELIVNAGALLYVCRLMWGDWQYSLCAGISKQAGVQEWFLSVTEAGVATTTYTVGATIVADVYYCIEIKRDVAGNTQELWINDVNVLSNTVAITRDADHGEVGIVWNTDNATAHRLFTDCVVIADARVYCKVAPPVPAYPLIGKPLIAPIIVGRPKIR